MSLRFLLISLLATVGQLVVSSRVIAAADTASTIRGVIDEYENTVRANTMKIIEAKTEEERNKYRASVPSVAPYAAKVLKIVEEHSADPGSAKGVSWLITQAAGLPEGQKALQLLGTTHVASSGVAEAVKALENQPFEMAEPILKAVREKNPNATEKAAAIYALGVHHFRVFESAPTSEAGKAARDKALECFQDISANFATASIQGFPLADQAGRMMFEMMNLAVGVEVPEIDGKDVDGTSFKLSEQRGKHVVLIFWGGWCHACHGILPLVNQLATELKGKKAVVLGVNTDIPDEARKAYQEYKVNFRNWSDGTTSGPITTLFNLRNFPTFYLIGPDGKILLKNASFDAVREALKGL